MKILPFVYHIWILGFLMMIFFFNFTISITSFINPGDRDRSIIYMYHRFDEVRKECGSVLNSPSELKPEDDRGTRIQNELSFSNGDWEQEGNGTVPLMTFDDTDLPKGYSAFGSLLKLVSFWVTDVDQFRRSENMLSISGLLYLGISINISLSHMSNDWSPEFSNSPGISTLSIHFEGIYIESEENGGERVMCLLGNPKVPSPEKFIDHWESLNVYGFDRRPYDPSHLQADKMLLVLRYPQTFSLTSRAIHGELKSLDKESNLSYFDKVYISSQLSHSSKYHFGSEELVSKSCNSYQYQHVMMDNMIGVSEASEFCRIYKQLISQEFFDILPEWNLNSTNESTSHFGPFRLGRKNEAMNVEFHKFALVMQDLHCETGNSNSIFSTAKVSAVFRAISPMENRYAAKERSGLGMTLSAEGIWNSSSGQLCMVGCEGFADSGTEVCNSQIQLYFPQAFSIAQRSVIGVTISSISSANSYIPLSFGTLLKSANPWDGRFKQYSNSRLFYNFSKIELASNFRLRSESFFNLENLVKKFFVRYPNVDNENKAGIKFAGLSNDLSVREYAIQMEILSVGPLFGHYCTCEKETSLQEIHSHAKAEFPKPQLLNISAHLTFTREYYDISMLFLEGIYDPVIGKLYLIGCRSIHNASNKSRDLEEGLDCLIEVKVEYSSETTRWLTTPTLKISISSQRSQDDHLYFHSISFRTVRLNQRMKQDTTSRQSFEMILKVLMLSVATLCILSQLVYIGKMVDHMPYVSAVMLGLQAFGYCLSLIIDTDILFKWKVSAFERRIRYYGPEQKPRYDVLDCTAKLLLMTAFQLTLRLYQKIRESRKGLSKLTSIELQKIPREKLVSLVTLATHMIGFFFVLSIHNMNASLRPILSKNALRLAVHPHNPWQWVMVLQGCIGLFEDLFLLPQIIGHFVWKTHVKPLSKVYYIGFTAMRLLFHVYNCITYSVGYHEFQENAVVMVLTENSSLDLYPMLDDIAMSMTLVVFAVVVYLQQRWNYQRLSQTDKLYENLLAAVEITTFIFKGVLVQC